jgi:hypothetical protein
MKLAGVGPTRPVGKIRVKSCHIEQFSDLAL